MATFKQGKIILLVRVIKDHKSGAYHKQIPNGPRNVILISFFKAFFVLVLYLWIIAIRNGMEEEAAVEINHQLLRLIKNKQIKNLIIKSFNFTYCIKFIQKQY